jgi:hypothetical protein
MEEISKKRATLLVGAGASAGPVGVGIPSGYGLAIQFAEANRSELDASLRKALGNARSDRDKESAFAQQLVSTLRSDPTLQEIMTSWIERYPRMTGGQSDDHAIFAAAWLKRFFSHLVTTNWDFLLEDQIDSLYTAAYEGDQFSTAQMELSDGDSLEIAAEQLFFPEQLDTDEFAWNPRWDMVASPADLDELTRYARPVWKIHGSPFFLACPECRGINRWKRIDRPKIGDPCPVHPDLTLQPEIIFWGERLDHAYGAVWKAIKSRMLRSRLVVAVGFSGTDEYIQLSLAKHPNLWIVSRSPGMWGGTDAKFVEATGTMLAAYLKPMLMT